MWHSRLTTHHSPLTTDHSPIPRHILKSAEQSFQSINHILLRGQIRIGNQARAAQTLPGQPYGPAGVAGRVVELLPNPLPPNQAEAIAEMKPELIEAIGWRTPPLPRCPGRPRRQHQARLGQKIDGVQAVRAKLGSAQDNYFSGAGQSQEKSRAR